MDSTASENSLINQMLVFFGHRPGQNARAFRDEVAALTALDAREIAELLCAAGYPCELEIPVPPAA